MLVTGDCGSNFDILRPPAISESLPEWNACSFWRLLNYGEIVNTDAKKLKNSPKGQSRE